ncbi:hypothetical protein Y1Q_0014705 [Alligator mississippiensis]|uniref:Uncharacterized protein n=1 Tax=Alligator mississippiensis TaxID=8496 RepID=A0A151P8F4_ALLMI|nr:hypothetical protein Y1Q_0014705 [Alligator mississippiensis]
MWPDAKYNYFQSSSTARPGSAYVEPQGLWTLMTGEKECMGTSREEKLLKGDESAETSRWICRGLAWTLLLNWTLSTTDGLWIYGGARKRL